MRAAALIDELARLLLEALAVVTTWAAAHYDRAYRAEMRKSGDKEGAARAGRRARRAFVASWARRLRVVGEQPKAEDVEPCAP